MKYNNNYEYFNRNEKLKEINDLNNDKVNLEQEKVNLEKELENLKLLTRKVNIDLSLILDEQGMLQRNISAMDHVD